tara:strand:- start:288 stop:530 length:243 start_codon:yes stop_codon:yes gene_type:complete
MIFILLLLFTFHLSAQEANCPSEDFILNRSIYSIGDTLSIEDQNTLFPVCNGSNNYSTGDSFSFSDFNGKITIVSMNATW